MWWSLRFFAVVAFDEFKVEKVIPLSSCFGKQVAFPSSVSMWFALGFRFLGSRSHIVNFQVIFPCVHDKMIVE